MERMTTMPCSVPWQSPSRLQKYINGGRSDLLAFYLHSYHGLLMGMVLLTLIYRAWKGKPELWDVLIINLCGAYLFYLIWEVDQAYSIPFLLILTALGAEGISLSVEDARRPERELPEFFGWIPAVSGSILLVEVLAVVLVMKVTGLPGPGLCSAAGSGDQRPVDAADGFCSDLPNRKSI